ncbi:MAG TPA: NTP transferase domain-containing protein [Angustibacter sp.]|nr:NTP transferase domain-containing protein [Angustibacter sp.]
MLHCVIVLAGGSSRRLGHDKIVAALATGTVLDELLGSLDEQLPATPVVCVGPPRVTQRQVTWLIEDPPGGGPVAGLARALDDVPDAAWLAVVAGDQPFAGPAVGLLAREAAGAPSDVDAVLALDDGHAQPLLAAYRAGPLRAAIGDQRADRSVRSVVRALRVREVAVPPGSALDVDTADDLQRARTRAGGDLRP